MLAMGPAQQSFAEGYSGRLLCPLEVVPIAGRRLNLRASSLRECAERAGSNPDGCGLRAGLVASCRARIAVDAQRRERGRAAADSAGGAGAGAGAGAEGGAGQQPVAG